MTDILAAIDAATGCQQCQGPLGDSPSGDFCTPVCFKAWHEERADPKAVLDSYRMDQHVWTDGNLDCDCCRPTPPWGWATFTFTVDTTAFDEAFHRLGEGFRWFAEACRLDGGTITYGLIRHDDLVATRVYTAHPLTDELPGPDADHLLSRARTWSGSDAQQRVPGRQLHHPAREQRVPTR